MARIADSLHTHTDHSRREKPPCRPPQRLAVPLRSFDCEIPQLSQAERRRIAPQQTTERPLPPRAASAHVQAVCDSRHFSVLALCRAQRPRTRCFPLTMDPTVLLLIYLPGPTAYLHEQHLLVLQF